MKKSTSLELLPAIEQLEVRLREAKHQAAALRTAINWLCIEAGKPPRYEEGEGRA